MRLVAGLDPPRELTALPKPPIAGLKRRGRREGRERGG